MRLPGSAPELDICGVMDGPLNFESHYADLTGYEEVTFDLVDAFLSKAASLPRNCMCGAARTQK